MGLPTLTSARFSHHPKWTRDWLHSSAISAYSMLGVLEQVPILLWASDVPIEKSGLRALLPTEGWDPWYARGSSEPRIGGRKESWHLGTRSVNNYAPPSECLL